MHILLIVNHYPNKSDTHRGVKFRQHVKYYRKLGHDVSVLAVNQRYTKGVLAQILNFIKNRRLHTVEEDLGGQVYRDYCAHFLTETYFYKVLRLFGINPNKLKSKIAARLFSKVKMTQGMPHIIHAHGSQWSGACAYIIAKKYDLPYVLTEHMTIYERNLVNPKDMTFMRRIFHSASYLFTISENLRGILDQKIGRENLGQSCTMPNMLDPEVFKLPSTKNRNEKFIFFSISRLVSMKRFDLMLDAFAHKFANKEKYELRIAGDGELTHELIEHAKRLGIEKQVHFLGALHRHEVVKEMQACDAYLLSSDYETFGIPLVEAGFCGKPVISTNVTGPDSIVSDRVGMLVPKGDKEAFAQAMENMVNLAPSYSSQKIRDYYVSQYSAPKIVERLEDVYKQVLSI